MDTQLTTHNVSLSAIAGHLLLILDNLVDN